MTVQDSLLRLTKQHVSQGTAAVAHQQEIIARLKSSGASVSVAEGFLGTLRATQSVFLDDRDGRREAARVQGVAERKV